MHSLYFESKRVKGHRIDVAAHLSYTKRGYNPVRDEFIMRYEYNISLKVDMDDTNEEIRAIMNDAVRQAAQLIFAQAQLIMQGEKRVPHMAVTCDDGYTDTVNIDPFAE